MAILTKPSVINKNTSATFSISKSELASHPSITDTYFQNTSNWKSVILVYKSSIGNQNEVLIFDATLATPTSNFLVSVKARDIFQIKRIVINDFDKGYFKIERADLTTAQFDIDLSIGGQILLTRDFSSPASFLGDSIPTQINGNYSFNSGNLQFTTTSPGGFVDYLYTGNIIGFIPTNTHKLRIHISNYTGGLELVTAIGQEFATPKFTTSAQLSAAVGSYIEVTGTGSGDNVYKFSLEAISKNSLGVNTAAGSISISKIELIKL